MAVEVESWSMTIFQPGLRKWRPAIALMIVIFGASSLTGAELPTFGSWDYFVKKGGHALGYFLLALAYLRGLRGSARGSSARLYWSGWLLAVLYAMTDEFHQSFVPGRHPSPLDVLVFDGAGAALAMLLSHAADKKIAGED